MAMHAAKRFRGQGKDRKQVKRRKDFGKVENGDNFQNVLALPARLAEFAQLLLSITPATWAFALDKLRQNTAYHVYPISKGPGKAPRKISQPCNELQEVQRAILNRFLRELPVHFARQSNRPGASIMKNAAMHAGARAVFSLDLVDAFPSVWRSRVRAVLSGPLSSTLTKQFLGEEFSEEDRSKLLESFLDLLLHNDRLPQGPSSSPRLLDICLFEADRLIWQLLRKHSNALQRFTVTGYADDYTISSDGEIPEPLRIAVIEILNDLGWRVHTSEDKTKYMSPQTGEVPVVLGLVLTPDGRITMAPRKVNQIRGRLHHLIKMPEWDTKARGLAAGLHGYVTFVYGDKPPSDLRKLMVEIGNRMTHPVVPFIVPPEGAVVEPSTDPAATTITDPTTEGTGKKKRRKKAKGSGPANSTDTTSSSPTTAPAAPTADAAE